MSRRFRRWKGRRAGFSRSVRARRGVRRTKSRRKFIYGKSRTSGFYGRFGPRSGELKFHDVDLDDAVIAAGANVTASINLIPQGVTEIQRIGRKCTIRNINWRFNIFLGSQTSSSNSADVVRVIMYLDKQANGATAANTDVLESADFQSFNNLANKSRFRTLMDRTYAINAQAGGGDGTTEDYGLVQLEDSFYKNCNIPIEWDSTTGAITEIRSNNIGVILCSSSGLAGLNSKIRLRFSDSG